MAEREQRPVADIMSLQNEMSKIVKHPPRAPSLLQQQTRQRGRTVQTCLDLNQRLLEAGRQYKRGIRSDDIFRIMHGGAPARAPRLLVFECIQYSIACISSMNCISVKRIDRVDN